MPANPPRSYSSPLREQQANATRRRILLAASNVFAELGFATVSMGRIAGQAGVSVATVYLYFSGKAAIVGALADELITMPDLSVEHVEREADPIRQLRIGARIMRQLNERSWLIADILRNARGSDETLLQIWIAWQERHLHAVRRAVEALHDRGVLRDGLELEDAIDAFYALTGTEVYRCLTQERGWSPEQYEEWLFQLGCRELLETPGTSTSI